MKPKTLDSPINLLLVEDDPESGEALRVMLERRNISVKLVGSAEEALGVLTDDLDVIVSDIRLNGMSGVDLLGRIREKSVDFPMILLTGYDSITSAIQAVRLGAQDYILKPLDVIEDLLVPVEKAVRGHRLLLNNRFLEDREKSIQERLARAQRMESISVMAGGVAHDLNNLMFPLLGYPDTIMQELESPVPDLSAVRREVMEIKSSAVRALEMFRDLLTLSRSGSYPVKPVNLNSVLAEYLDGADVEAIRGANPPIEVLREPQLDLPPILGSAVQLRRAIMNVVLNAAEAMPAGGTITLRTRSTSLKQKLEAYEVIEPGEYSLLEVVDNGSGIPPENLSHIFEPFFSRKEQGHRSGTGLGLAVVHGVVKDHHGFIDVKSVPGKGTSFSLYFPVAPSMEAVAHSATRTAAASGSGKGAILVVDDDPRHLSLASRHIAALGYQVQTAGNGRSAIQCIETAPPGDSPFALVLLDMCMGADLDGLETYREIVRRRSGQRCILMSGFNDQERIRQAQRLGAGRFLAKPYTLTELAEVIQSELSVLP